MLINENMIIPYDYNMIINIIYYDYNMIKNMIIYDPSNS